MCFSSRSRFIINETYSLSRFQAQLREKINTFSQRWNLKYIDFEKFEPAPHDAKGFNTGGLEIEGGQKPPKIDLVLVASDETYVPVSRQNSVGRQRNKNVTTHDDANSLISSV